MGPLHILVLGNSRVKSYDCGIVFDSCKWFVSIEASISAARLVASFEPYI